MEFKIDRVGGQAWFNFASAVGWGIITSKWAPEMVPVALLVMPIAHLIYHDETDRKPLWKFGKDKA